MPKTPMGFRIDPDVKAALERAALDDGRSTASLINKILRDWVANQDKENGK